MTKAYPSNLYVLLCVCFSIPVACTNDMVELRSTINDLVLPQYEYSHEFGEFGTGPGQLYGIWDMGANSRGEIYVVDSPISFERSGFHVYDNDGTYLRFAETDVNMSGREFVIDSADRVIVLSASQQISIYSSSGSIQDSWSISGINIEFRISSLAVFDSDVVYLAGTADNSGIVFRYIDDGTLDTFWYGAVGDFGVLPPNPEDIAVDSHERVYLFYPGGEGIYDEKYKIWIFDKSGNFLDGWQDTEPYPVIWSRESITLFKYPFLSLSESFYIDKDDNILLSVPNIGIVLIDLMRMHKYTWNCSGSIITGDSFGNIFVAEQSSSTIKKYIPTDQ